MNRQAENRLRDLLQERAGDVAPATDWESRVLGAGRRRRRNRRIGVGLGAAVAIAVVAIGVNSVVSPLAFDDPGIANTPSPSDLLEHEQADDRVPPSQAGAPAGWQSLPVGEQTKLPYSYGKRLATPALTTDEVPDRFVGLAQYGEGVLLVTRWEDLSENNDSVRLMVGDKLPYIPPRSARQDNEDEIGGGSNLSPIFVSASGRYVAYTSRPTQGSRKPFVQAIDLTAGASFVDHEPGDVETTGVPGSVGEGEEFTQSIGFVGEDLVVSSRNQAYLWKRGQAEPEPWLLGGKRVERFLGVSQQAGIVLVGDADGTCVTALELANGVERWKQCSAAVGTEFSLDGKVIAGAQGDTVVFRSAATGEVVRTARVPGLTIGQLVWETTSDVLAVVSGEKGSEPAMIRCGSESGTCEGVPSLLAGKQDSPLLIARRPSK